MKDFCDALLTHTTSSSQGRISRSWFSRFIEDNSWVDTVATVSFFYFFQLNQWKVRSLILSLRSVTISCWKPLRRFGTVLSGWLFKIFVLMWQTAFLICHQSRLSEPEMTRFNTQVFMPETAKTTMHFTTLKVNMIC